MAKYLISVTETYRADTENEAAQMIEEAKHDKHFILAKYSTEMKEVKQKGEVIDTYAKVSLVKSFTDIKEPEFQTKISYDTGYMGDEDDE